MGIRTLTFATLIVVAGGASAMHLPTDEELNAISRCSNAAYEVVKAAEISPLSKKTRASLIRERWRDLSESRQLGQSTPSFIEVITAQASMEALLADGQKPGDSRRMHDWFVAQTAATCVVAGNPSK